MRWIVRGAISVAAIAALIVAYCAYLSISASLHAEHVLHAAIITSQLLEEYVDTHDGQWPRSWADLEKLPSRDWAMYAWPKDSLEVQKYVEVDFAADPRQLAKQDAAEFDAIRPIGPYFPFKDGSAVQSLLRTLREHAASE